MTIGIQVVVDCEHPHELAKFWAAAVGYEVQRDEAFIRQMLEGGFATDDDVSEFEGALVWRTAEACNDPGGVRPRLLFMQVPEPKQGKNRVHMDLHLHGADRDAEVARLTALGARVLYEGRHGPQTWITMADPEGNEFCVS